MIELYSKINCGLGPSMQTSWGRGIQVPVRLAKIDFNDLILPAMSL